MCGIVGYVGERDCTDVLLDSLSKLEYRGYDSAGIAVFENGEITDLIIDFFAAGTVILQNGADNQLPLFGDTKSALPQASKNLR